MGQPLIELDATLTQADEKRQNNELNDAKTQLIVHTRFLELLSLADKDQQHITYTDMRLNDDSDMHRDNGDVYQRLLGSCGRAIALNQHRRRCSDRSANGSESSIGK